jgi:hypothetical protein
MSSTTPEREQSMRDAHDDRLYQAHRGEFARDIARLFGSIAFVFDRLTAKLYDAPWSRRETSRNC